MRVSKPLTSGHSLYSRTTAEQLHQSGLHLGWQNCEPVESLSEPKFSFSVILSAIEDVSSYWHWDIQTCTWPKTSNCSARSGPEHPGWARLCLPEFSSWHLLFRQVQNVPPTLTSASDSSINLQLICLKPHFPALLNPCHRMHFGCSLDVIQSLISRLF